MHIAIQMHNITTYMRCACVHVHVYAMCMCACACTWPAQPGRGRAYARSRARSRLCRVNAGRPGGGARRAEPMAEPGERTRRRAQVPLRHMARRGASIGAWVFALAAQSLRLLSFLNAVSMRSCSSVPTRARLIAKSGCSSRSSLRMRVATSLSDAASRSPSASLSVLLLL